MRISDWSSDVCSSDLAIACLACRSLPPLASRRGGRTGTGRGAFRRGAADIMARAEGKLAVAGRACHPHRWGRRSPEALASNGAARLGRTMAYPLIPPPAAPYFLTPSGCSHPAFLPPAVPVSFRLSFPMVQGGLTAVHL